MKKLLLFTVMGFCCTNLFAQYVNVVQTNPAANAFDVDQDSIVLEFDTPIVLDIEQTEESGFIFFVEPESAVTFDSLAINEEGTIVTIYVQLEDSTDYIGFLIDVQGQNGETLQTPYVFQFTTANEAGAFTVEGTLDDAYLDTKDPSDPGYSGMVVILTSMPLNFGLEIDEDFEEGEESEEGEEGENEDEDFIPLYAASVDVQTGQYSVSGVREGVYYPLSVDATFEIEEQADEFFFPDLFIYDPDDDLEPDSVTLNEEVVPTGTLSGVDLTYLDFSPILFSEAVERTLTAIQKLENTPVIMGGASSYFYENYTQEISFTKLRVPQLQIHRKAFQPVELRANEPVKAKIKADFTAPDGLNLFWEMYAYDADKDSVAGYLILPFGNFFAGYLSEEDVELDVPFSTLKPLPENYLDSDEAIQIAEDNGGSELREVFLESRPNTYSGVEIWISNIHEYWTYTPNPTETAPLFWKVEYYGYRYDFMEEEYEEDSLIVFMDIESGDVLLPTSAEAETNLPQSINLHQNYPNPFNPSTNIAFALNKSTQVELSVYNLLGQKVAQLVNEVYPAGNHSVQWEASKMASGIYLYRLKAADVIQSRKMLLLK